MSWSTSTHWEVPIVSPPLVCSSCGVMPAINHPLNSWFGARSRPLFQRYTRAKPGNRAAVASAGLRRLCYAPSGFGRLGIGHDHRPVGCCRKGRLGRIGELVSRPCHRVEQADADIGARRRNDIEIVAEHLQKQFKIEARRAEREEARPDELVPA